MGGALSTCRTQYLIKHTPIASEFHFIPLTASRYPILRTRLYASTHMIWAKYDLGGHWSSIYTIVKKTGPEEDDRMRGLSFKFIREKQTIEKQLNCANLVKNRLIEQSCEFIHEKWVLWFSIMWIWAEFHAAAPFEIGFLGLVNEEALGQKFTTSSTSIEVKTTRLKYIAGLA